MLLKFSKSFEVLSWKTQKNWIYKMKLFFKLAMIFVSLLSFSVNSAQNNSELGFMKSNVQTSSLFDRQMCIGRMDGYLFQDSENCQAFIECQRQEPNRRICATGTLFNVDLYYCTAAHIVDCKNRPKPSTHSENVISNTNFPSSLETHHRVILNLKFYILKMSEISKSLKI